MVLGATWADLIFFITLIIQILAYRLYSVAVLNDKKKKILAMTNIDSLRENVFEYLDEGPQMSTHIL